MVEAVKGKFGNMVKARILQSLLLFACISLLLLLHNSFGGIIAASLGASGFILFVIPHKSGSRARNLVGGYACGAIAGILSNLLYGQVSGLSFPGVGYTLIFICAAAPGLATFLMTTSNFIHPPAAALALGLSLEQGPECIKTAITAMAGVIILCLTRYILRKYLKNLV